jgi:SAM-dependent methyltransferase
LSTDYVGSLLERGRARAEADGLSVIFQEADAENLPFADASFDVVLSTFGVMFTPNQEQAARELMRVCRPGGKIGMANWTPESFVGRLFKIIGKYVPPAPGVKSPALWGNKAYLEVVLGPQAIVAAESIFCLPLQVARTLGRGLPHLLRPGSQGVRGDRLAGPRGARGGSLRADRRFQRRR